MRNIKLTGREAAVVRVIGFTDSTPGGEILDRTHMDLEDVTDTLNGLISAGLIESTPHREHIEMTDMAMLMFSANPAYTHDLKAAFKPR